jgi:hypothetical protein
VRDDDPKMLETLESVKVRGVRTPGLVRPDPDGGYEIISGHRRHRASELAGLADMPVIIRELNDEEAVIELVDANIQRENVLPSEKAWAYRMRLEAEKRRAGRPSNNSPQVAAKFRSDDQIGQPMGISGDTLRRYISLTELIPQLMMMVDSGTIGDTGSIRTGLNLGIISLRTMSLGYASYNLKSDTPIKLAYTLIPNKTLHAEYVELLATKKKSYAEYSCARQEMRELLTAKANVDRLMGYDEKQTVTGRQKSR